MGNGLLLLVASQWRMAVAHVKPSIPPGISRSMKIRSQSSSWAIWSPLTPFEATFTMNPFDSRTLFMKSWLSGVSSTTKTRLPSSGLIPRNSLVSPRIRNRPDSLRLVSASE